MPDIACKLISQLKSLTRAVFQGLCINYATKTAHVQALTDSTTCIYGLQFDDLPFATNKKRGISSTYGSCIWILSWRKNGARSSLINCMMIPTALDFPLATKESLWSTSHCQICFSPLQLDSRKCAQGLCD